MPGPGSAVSAWSLSGAYRTVITQRPNLDTLMLDGLVNAPGVGPVLLVSLALLTAVAYVRLLSGLIPFVQRALRVDLAAWLLAGACLSAFFPFLIIAHDGYSQFYFLFGVVPLGTALWAWSIGELVGNSLARARVAAWTLGLGAAVTIPAGFALNNSSPPEGEARGVSALGTFAGRSQGPPSSSSPWPPERCGCGGVATTPGCRSPRA